jgi:hypothetical protein
MNQCVPDSFNFIQSALSSNQVSKKRSSKSITTSSGIYDIISRVSRQSDYSEWEYCENPATSTFDNNATRSWPSRFTTVKSGARAKSFDGSEQILIIRNRADLLFIQDCDVDFTKSFTKGRPLVINPQHERVERGNFSGRTLI